MLGEGGESYRVCYPLLGILRYASFTAMSLEKRSPRCLLRIARFVVLRIPSSISYNMWVAPTASVSPGRTPSILVWVKLALVQNLVFWTLYVGA